VCAAATPQQLVAPSKGSRPPSPAIDAISTAPGWPGSGSAFTVSPAPSTAQPSQSKPGPRLATVAGAKAVAEGSFGVNGAPACRTGVDSKGRGAAWRAGRVVRAGRALPGARVEVRGWGGRAATAPRRGGWLGAAGGRPAPTAGMRRDDSIGGSAQQPSSRARQVVGLMAVSLGEETGSVDGRGGRSGARGLET